MKLLVLLVAVLVCEVSSKVLPDFIPQCKRKDPEFVKCVLAAVDKVKPYILKGIPEIKVPSYEPLEIQSLAVDRDLEAIKIKASLDNMKVYGGSAFKVKNLKIDLDKLTAELMLTIPKLQVMSDYGVAGKLLVIPLAGKGRLEGNFTDCSTQVKGKGKIVMKDGVEYMQIESLKTKLKIGGGHVKFFDDGANTFIAETAANFFNASPRLVLDILNPIIEDTTDVVIGALLNRIFGSIPYSELILNE